MKRREFIKVMSAATSSMLLACQASGGSEDRLGQTLPHRSLGSTGESVTMLGVGGYHIGWTTEKDAQHVIETALQGGVRFFDTAESYQDGESERRYGNYLTPNYRDLVFLMTKSTARDAETAQRHLDESLERLQTDHVDLWQVHSLQDPQDVETRIENGVLEVFRKAKQEGKARYIGFTGHRNPAAHVRMLELTAGDDLFDTCQMPVNVLDPSYHSFINQVMPTLTERQIGVLAMKTLADGRFFPVKRRLQDVQWQTDEPVIPDRISIQDALNFAWSLPTSVLITGAENANYMQEKIELAAQFNELDTAQRQHLVETVADLAKQGKYEYFKRIES